MTHSVRLKYQANKMSASALRDRFFIFILFGNGKLFSIALGAHPNICTWNISILFDELYYAQFGYQKLYRFDQMSFENISCYMIAGATPFVHGGSMCIDFQLKPQKIRVIRLRTFDCLCRDVEYLFILLVYSSMRCYCAKELHLQFNTICTRGRKGNQIERVVWVTRQEDVCVCERERESGKEEKQKIDSSRSSFDTSAMCSRWF